MLTITVEPGTGWTSEQHDELAAKVRGAARQVLGDDVRIEVAAEPPLDAKARREAAVLAASWSGC